MARKKKAEVIVPPKRADVSITYPATGGVRSVSTGTVITDFFEGVVTLTDGTQENLSGSLRTHGHQWARSLLVESNKDVILQTDGMGKGSYTVKADTPFSIENHEFQKVFITTTTTTEIRIWGSTSLKGIPRKIDVSAVKRFIEGRTTSYEDTNFVAGDSPAVHDVNTDLGRNSHTGYIICDGGGDITIEFSNDGSTYGGSHTLKQDETMNLDLIDIDRIRITWVANSAYRIFVL